MHRVGYGKAYLTTPVRNTLACRRTQILVLGAIAGLTIFIGLPAGRIRRLPPGASAFLSATATGILLFLLWDVLSAGLEPVESALTAAALDHDGTWARFAGLAALFVARVRRRPDEPRVLRRADREEAPQRADRRASALPSPSSRVSRTGRSRRRSRSSLMIATGIGLHNFSEGLAIGQSARGGRHQPRARAHHRLRPAQRDRGVRHRRPVREHARAAELGVPPVVGLIGGGPTFFGTLLGQTWVNDAVSIAFLALAAGSILYVVVELLNVCRRLGRKTAGRLGPHPRPDAGLRDRLRARRRRRLNRSRARRRLIGSRSAEATPDHWRST